MAYQGQVDNSSPSEIPKPNYGVSAEERIARISDGGKQGGYYAFRVPPYGVGHTEVLHFDKEGNPITDMADSKGHDGNGRITMDRFQKPDISYELSFSKKNNEFVKARTTETTGIGHTYALEGHPELAEDKMKIHPGKNESQYIPDSWKEIEKQNHTELNITPAIKNMSAQMTPAESPRPFPAGNTIARSEQNNLGRSS